MSFAPHRTEPGPDCAVRCETAREAVSIAENLRGLAGARVAVRPSLPERPCDGRWTVELRLADVRDPALRERALAGVQALSGARRISWLSAPERASVEAPSTAARASQRELVRASLLRHPEPSDG